MIRHTLTALAGTVLLMVAGERLGAQDISVGGRLGAVAGAVFFEDTEANDLMHPWLGLQIGGAAGLRFSSILSMQAELWYVQKGWTETEADGGRRLTYVELPLFIAVTAPWRTAPQLVAGASVSLELACAVTGVPEVGSVGCDDPRVEWHHATTQFGTWAGLGLRRWFGASHLDIQLLVNLNLTNLNREPLPRGYTRLLSGVVSAAYLVPIGGKAR
jgi:hypothetical protein